MGLLTLWYLAGFRDFHEKNRLHVALGARNVGAESGRELFKDSKDVVTLLVCTRKNISGWGVWIFVSDVISVGLLGQLGPLHLALGSNKPLDASISLKFLLETTLQSESFNTLDDLLRFLVQKL